MQPTVHCLFLKACGNFAHTLILIPVTDGRNTNAIHRVPVMVVLESSSRAGSSCLPSHFVTHPKKDSIDCSYICGLFKQDLEKECKLFLK